MVLHSERIGAGPVVALVHGFTQTGRSWAEAADTLQRDHTVVVVDAPGHGRSASVGADLTDGADLLVQAAGPATYVGYSMGARFCLHAALAHPDEVRGLVLVSGTAGLDTSEEREARVAADEALAERLEHLGVEAFLAEWLALPLFAGLPPERAGLQERLENSVAGLQSSLRRAGTGRQAPLWDRLGELAMPVLVVTGAADAKFTALAERLASGIGGDVELHVVEGAGHTVHLEQPTTFLTLLTKWLADHSL